ncbi:hypothetical protein BT93_L0945 [Corymbia citriodora subsp. variegata]|uniref:TIR domain-containing protein n=1 Tax=Corymbia citriodora subsp. variegata TaxID=360336 RepID=A0A8T0CYB6_CORYI|nr:hypothetical protein BT93_L0945 [Corymbia citriodora subsp. variegata]
MASDPGSSSSPSPSPVGNQVVASPLKIQEMEKPMEFDHDVFLSFRGPDTRRNIADYLYHSLTDAGIKVFRDNEELRVGEEIGPELLRAIKRSKISIPIFSKEYAASKWCLMELVQMVECREKWGQGIMPIFYDVAPSEVRYQTGKYGEAITSHINKRQRYDDETIEKWKAALNKVAALKGYELKDRGKGEFTKEVVHKVLFELKESYLAAPNCFVEMDDQVDKIMEVIGEDTSETKIVGIHGMGGVGKTTLATIVYNKLVADFDGHCFLSNARDTEILSLQNRLISNLRKGKSLQYYNIAEAISEIKNCLSSRKVLLVLDDVDEKTQLEDLVGKGKRWFCRGSRVIITTRNKEVLKDVDSKHELSEMNFDDSLLLFSRHAFRRDHPPVEYFPLSRKAVEVCGHLPLALVIIGSFLYEKDRKFWNTTLEKLGSIPDQKVEEKLNISIKALQPPAREIFLDICCLFIGYDVRIVRHMWEISGFHPDFYLDVLQQMSLIKITKHNRLWIHDIVRDIGRDFVRQNGDCKPEKQSRVWDHEQANNVLRAKGTENVEAMRLKFDHQSRCLFKKEEFASLSNLRFLQVDRGDLDMKNHCPSTKRFRRNLLILPNLRYLSWHEFPISFRLTAFSLMKIVILDLSRSQITNDWEGWNHLKMAKNLKVLNLTGCQNLCRTPDVSAHENLEQLILEGCMGLVQVDRSIGNTRISELPFGNFGSLVELRLTWSKIRELPNSIETMKYLKVLDISDTDLEKLPSAIGMLEQLEEINANDCGCLCGEIPTEIGNLSSLSIMRLSNTRISNIPKLPESMTDLYLLGNQHMRCPDLSNLLNLRDLRLELRYQTPSHAAPSLDWIGSLTKLEHLSLKLESLFLCCDSLVTLPSDFNLLSKLRKLELVVNNLECLPRLPQNLSYFHIHGRRLVEKSINLSYLEKLSELEVHNCKQLIEIEGLEHLKNLQRLHLNHLPLLVKLPDLTSLKKLWRLWIEDCPELVEIPGQLESLEEFYLQYCKSVEKLLDPLSFKHIEELSIYGCWKLKEVQGLEDSKKLSVLYVGDLPLLEKLPDLTNSKELKDLVLKHCPSLVEIQGRVKSLKRLEIDGCGSLQKFFDTSGFKKLECLLINECERLEEILESDEYKDLKKVRRAFKGLPRFMDSKPRRKYSIPEW